MCESPKVSAQSQEYYSHSQTIAVQWGAICCIGREAFLPSACREELALKMSITENHITHSKKHAVGKERLAEKGKQERNIVEALELYNREKHLRI